MLYGLASTKLAMKRTPRIKFPQRHKQLSGTACHSPGKEDHAIKIFSKNSPMPPGGKASDQPKRIPLSQQEIEAILMGGCI